MSSINITMTTPKSSMYYDRTYPITCFDNNVEADTENIRKKQYDYPKAFVSHGECIEAPVGPDTTELTAADVDLIRKKQYNYSGAFGSHGECIEAPAGPDTVELTAADVEIIRKKQYDYSKASVSHGETIEEVPEYVPKQKKYMWTSFVDFFKQRQKFQRYPFACTPNI